MKEKAAIVGSRNMFRVFLSMLGSVGGRFGRLVHGIEHELEQKARRKRHEQNYGKPEVRFMRPLSARQYYQDAHGTIHRITPKRDKTMSARQWRKQSQSARVAFFIQSRAAV